MIARVDTHTIEPLRNLGVPIVDVRCNRKFAGVPQVETDNQRVAELAFEHLWGRGFRRFAFCGFRFASYSDARLRSFQDLVEQTGCSFSSYQSEGNPGSPLTKLERVGIVTTGPSRDGFPVSRQRPRGCLFAMISVASKCSTCVAPWAWPFQTISA